MIFGTLTAMAKAGKIAAVLGLLAVSAIAYYAITSRRVPSKPPDPPRLPISVAGVNEPVELRVEPVPLPVLSPGEQALSDELKKPLPPNTKLDMIAVVNRVLKSHPDYGDGYAMRIAGLCDVPATKPEAIVSDINSAIKYGINPESTSPGDLLSFRARLEYSKGQFQAALTDLDNGMKSNLDGAAQMFNNGTVKPSDNP